MRYIFKTSYLQDIHLFKHRGHVFWYGLLLGLVLVAPLLFGDYYVGQLTQVGIYSIAGLGLMLLTGYTGQPSLGHAAFLGVGAYTEAVLLGYGWPFWLSFPMSGVLAAAVGLIVGPPALRLSGIYLTIGTLAFGFIVEEVLSRWESVTMGYKGYSVDDVEVFEVFLSEGMPFYYITMAVLVLVILFCLNLLRSPIGRAMVAVRDSEIAAQSMGVNLARTKIFAFFISAGITGLAGALWAHKLGFLSPESFTIFQSIEFLVLVIVGGLGSIHGAIFGSVFIVALPQAIAILKDHMPPAIAQQPSLESGIFGLILVLFVIFEPMGLYGRWLKLRFYFEMFPLYKKATFKRQKTFVKSERLR